MRGLFSRSARSGSPLLICGRTGFGSGSYLLKKKVGDNLCALGLPLRIVAHCSGQLAENSDYTNNRTMLATQPELGSIETHVCALYMILLFPKPGPHILVNMSVCMLNDIYIWLSLQALWVEYGLTVLAVHARGHRVLSAVLQKVPHAL